jgi:hypothetical protein
VGPTTKQVAHQFRAAQNKQLEALKRGVNAIYEEGFDSENIVSSVSRISNEVSKLIAAGQGAMQQTAAAQSRAIGLAETGRALDPLPLAEIVGTRLDGVTPIRAGMDAFGPMILDYIGQGHDTFEAEMYGGSLIERYADSEARGAADRELANQEQRPEIIGWEGIVDDDACDACQANAGVHELDEEIYRHGNCNCEKVPVYAGGAVAEEAPEEPVQAVDEQPQGQTVELPDPATAEGLAARAAGYEGELVAATPADATSALGDLQTMSAELGPVWADSPGAQLTAEALNAAGEGRNVYIAYDQGTVAGAILSEQRAAGIYSGGFGKAEMPELMHIHDVGSTGITPNTGSTLTWRVFKDAQEKGLGVSLDPLEEAVDFWDKMGAVPDPWGAGTDMWGLTAETIKGMKL